VIYQLPFPIPILLLPLSLVDPPPQVVDLEALRNFHLNAAVELGVSEGLIDALEELLNDLGRLLECIARIGDLTPRSRDKLVRAKVMSSAAV